MPKMKTHKGLRKRVKVTARGKVAFKKNFAGHLMSGKAGRRVRRLRQDGIAPDFLTDKIRIALGE